MRKETRETPSGELVTYTYSDDGELISTSGTRHCPYCGGPLRWHRLEDGTGGHDWCMECGYFSDW